jgi:hypothetical protein
MPMNWPPPCSPMPWSSSGRRTFTTLVAIVSGTALFWLLALTVWLVARRVSGGLRAPLPSKALWCAAAGASLAAIAIACSFNRVVSPVAGRTLRIGLASLLVVTLVVLGASISLPESGTLGLAGAWATLSAAGCWLLTRSGRTLAPAVTFPGRSSAFDASASGDLIAGDAGAFPVQVDQQWTRARDDDGQAYVEGMARVTFAAGQRTAHLHLAICPPLEHPPEVEAEQVAGPPAQVQVGLTLPQGVRVDVRRLESIDAEDSVIVAFFGK